MEPFELIVNHKALLDRFEGWPSFHDAEVQTVRLDNGNRSDGPVSVELDVHVFQGTSEVDQRGHFVWRLHTLVTIRFAGAVDINLTGFNEQNVLDGLEIWVGAEAVDAATINVELPSNYGLGGSLRCEQAAIIAVVPFEPGPHSVYGQG